MKRIPLFINDEWVAEALVDDCDYEALNKHVWHLNQGPRRSLATRQKRVGGKNTTIYMHREILGYKNGYITDHVNMDQLDNRRCNLRFATIQQNLCNRGKTRRNTSGFKGVTLIKTTGKWKAQITVKYKSRNLGHFSKKEDAHAAYIKAASELHGEFAHA